MTSKLTFACVLLAIVACSTGQNVTVTLNSNLLSTLVAPLKVLLQPIQEVAQLMGSAGQNLVTVLKGIATDFNNAVSGASSNATASLKDALENLKQVTETSIIKLTNATQSAPLTVKALAQSVLTFLSTLKLQLKIAITSSK